MHARRESEESSSFTQHACSFAQRACSFITQCACYEVRPLWPKWTQLTGFDGGRDAYEELWDFALGGGPALKTRFRAKVGGKGERGSQPAHAGRDSDGLIRRPVESLQRWERETGGDRLRHPLLGAARLQGPGGGCSDGA